MKYLTVVGMFLAVVGWIQAVELPPAIFDEGEVVLFQGDSITDMGRGRSNDKNHILGHGYVYLIASEYGAYYPEMKLEFINLGISGNTVEDLAKRWQGDTIAHKPDVVSILIGINDIYFAITQNRPIPVAQYEKAYDKLIAETRRARPGVKLILCEPFILPGSNTTPHWEAYQKAVKQFQVVVVKLGEKYHVPVVHFQPVFDDAAKLDVPADYWIWDGVHPTCAGHRLMADEWVRVYHQFYGDSLKKTVNKNL